MMAPYTVGHLKMSFLLEELGYKLTEDDRFQLYLTNTLEMKELEQSTLPFAVSLSEESQKADVVKKEQPILVIIGHPPYSGHSANRSKYEILLYEGERWVGKGKNRRKIKIKYKKPRRRILKTWIGEKIDDYKLIDGGTYTVKDNKI